MVQQSIGKKNEFPSDNHLNKTRIRSVERGNCPIAAVSEFAQYCCRSHMTLATPTSETFVSGHVGTIPGNTPAKFEVRIFSRFGAISI